MKPLTGLCAAVLVLLPAASRAGGYEIGPQTTVSAGTAGAGTARIDAGAAWLNPAALADGNGLRLGLGLTVAFSTVEARGTETDGDRWSTATDHGASTPPHVYASFAQARWAAGLSFNVPFGSQLAWPAAGPLRYEALRSSPRFYRLAPFFAWDFGLIRLAAGPHVDFGGYEIVKATDHVTDEGEVHLSMRGVGFGGHASLFAQVTADVALGLTYKSRTTLPLAGEADFEVPAAFSSRYFDQEVEADWVLPDRLVLGMQASLGSVSLVADLGVTFWSVNDALVIDFAAEETDDTRVSQAWRDSVALRAGADWAALPELTVRAGFAVDGIFGAPAPSRNVTPTSPDGTRLQLTAGASWHIGAGFSADCFYEHLRLLSRTSTSDDAPLAAYEGWAHVMGLGLRYEPGRR